jgi:hypothetical protein
MRILKILTVAVTMTASLVIGVAGTASAASVGSAHVVRPANWCC